MSRLLRLLAASALLIGLSAAGTACTQIGTPCTITPEHPVCPPK